jgi:hypothetical protein
VLAAAACTDTAGLPPSTGPSSPSVRPSDGVAALGPPVASPIEGLPVPQVARLLTHRRSPAPDAQGGQTAESDVADYTLPGTTTVTSLDDWYLQVLPADGTWHDWRRNFPSPGQSSISRDKMGDANSMGYAWTRNRECLTIESTEKNGNLGIRLVRSNRDLCLQ